MIWCPQRPGGGLGLRVIIGDQILGDIRFRGQIMRDEMIPALIAARVISLHFCAPQELLSKRSAVAAESNNVLSLQEDRMNTHRTLGKASGTGRNRSESQNVI